MEKPDLSLFPTTPGVYLYKDAQGHILYVGKARKLRNRLASYFRDPASLSAKTKLMLRHAEQLDILQTGTEKEALLLEASLIKKHRPRYNIVLRDDKEYLLFRIGNDHPFPRVEVIRHSAKSRKKAQGKLFGPFTSGTAARETWRLIHKHFPLRRCRNSAFTNRTRPCLYYHMNQCLGPCVLAVNPAEYQAILNKVSMLLSGKSRELIVKLHEEMEQAAEQLQFEKAATLRDQIKAVERTIERQSVVLAPGASLDLIGVAQIPEGLALGIVFVRDGLLIDGRNFFWPGLIVEDTPELLYSFLSQYYLTDRALLPPRIVVPWLPETVAQQHVVTDEKQPHDADTTTTQRADDTEQPINVVWAEMMQDLKAAMSEYHNKPVQITTPRSVDEDNLVMMATSNAREHVKVTARPPISDLLAARFHASNPIRRIEAIDISHTGGQQTRAGLVVFMDQEPVPSDYRTYALDDDMAASGAEQGDDYAALACWAKRRAKAGAPWPDLMLIDGGKGQLAAVYRVFSEILGDIPFILAAITKARTDDGKADRRAGNVQDRIFVPQRSNPLNFTAGCAELLFLQRIRDAVHDFAIGKHRQARTAATLAGELSRIPGIGPHLAKQLFATFGSLAAMANAREEDLLRVPGIGKAKAAQLYARLQLLVSKK